MAQKTRGLTLDEITAETKKLAADLAFHARAPVSIQLGGGQHLAYTYATDESKKQHHIPIVMNPDVVKSVRNKEQAIKIWRGIGYHELAHHLYPANTQYKAAAAEGFRDLFNLVDDEQNERLARAMNPEWGTCFQAVCAHIFSSKKRLEDTLNTGIVDGGKENKKPRGIAAHKIYARRWNQFKYPFRRHLPNLSVDPAVADALALIPKNFIDLSKPQLLDLTRQIHLTLARGLEMPNDHPPTEEPEEEKEKKEEEKKEEEKQDEPVKDDKDADPEPEPKDAPSKKSWSLKRLLTSKWMLLPFGLFIVIWTLLLLQGGIDFWVQVAVMGTIALGLITAFLFARRSMIKALMAKIAAAGRGTDDAPGPVSKVMQGLRSKQVRIFLLAVLGAILVYLLWELAKWIGFMALMVLLEFAMIVGALMVAGKLGKAEKEKPPSKWATSGLTAAVIVGVVLMAGTLYFLGFGLLLILPLVLLLFMGGMLGLFMLLPSKADGQSNGTGYKKEPFWVRLRRVLREKWEDFWSAIWGGIKAFFKGVGRFFAAIGIGIARACVWFWRSVIMSTARFIARVCTRAYWRVEPHLTRMWRNSMFRLAVVALPVATLIVIIYAVCYAAGQVSPWLLVILILVLLLLLLLGFLFRKKIKKFIVTELLMPMPSLMDMCMQVPLDMDTEWFVQVDNVVPVEPDQAVIDELQPLVHALAQQLRPYLQKCGKAVIDRDDQPEGFDLVDEAELALVGETSIFVNDDEVPKPSVHLEVALDCSSSMASATATLKPGDKFKLGKFFALVLEQATINLPGVSARFWGFTNDTIYDCGAPGEGRVSGLKCGGGNNDAAMLWHMGQSASKSGKDVKILLMLSDGQPSECSWLSLHNLVLQFEQEGMIPWNFALDVIQIPAFKRFFTDLVGQTMDEAIVTMGETLATIAQESV